MTQASDFSQDKLTEAMNRTITYEMNAVTNPSYGSIGGEWAILGIARSGNMNDDYRQAYLGNLKQTLDDCGGVLSSARYTDYSRVVLALSALGMDATNVYGYPVLQYLGDYDKVTATGVNGAAFALLALDSRKYKEPDLPSGAAVQTTRDLLIRYILSHEAAEGGFGVSGAVADVDMTAIVLTALAPYRESYPSVNAAVERGITILSKLQRENGGYQSYNLYTSESLSQVLVAMSTLQIDVTDERFTKNGITVLDALLAYQNEDGSFSHIQGTGANLMATEQALYAMAALLRMKQGQNSLYDMTDGLDAGQLLHPTMTIGDFLQRCQAISETPVIDDETEINLLLLEYEQHDLFENKEAVYQKLLCAKAYIDAQKQTTEALSADIWNRIDPLRIDQKCKAVVKALLERYDALQKADQKHVKYAEDLLAANEIVTQLDEGVIPAKIWENMERTKESFLYEGKINKKITYAMKFSYQQIKEKKNLSVKVNKGKKKTVTLPEGAVGFYFSESEDFPASATLSVSGLVKNGTYTLYHVRETSKNKNDANAEEKIAVVTVKKGTFSVKINKGGQYYLIAVQNQSSSDKDATQADTVDQNSSAENTASASQAEQAQGNPNTLDAVSKPEKSAMQKEKKQDEEQTASDNRKMAAAAEKNMPKHIISKQQLERILGKDENIAYEEVESEQNPYSYRVIINGTDLTCTDQTCLKLAFHSVKDQEIAELADNPFVFRFVQYQLPGTVFIQTETSLSDGDYLLCFYDAQKQLAEVVKKVQIKDAQLKCTVSRGGIYFVTNRLAVVDVDKENKAAKNDAQEDDRSVVIPERSVAISDRSVVIPDSRVFAQMRTEMRMEMLALGSMFVLFMLAGVLLLVRKRME